MSSILLEIVLFDNGISLCFAAHWLSQTTSHISIGAGRIKFSAIMCDDLVQATLNATKYDAFNKFSFHRRNFVKPSFCFKYSLDFLSKKDCGLLANSGRSLIKCFSLDGFIASFGNYIETQ